MRLVNTVLSVLFPVRLELKLSQTELHTTMEFVARDSRHQHGLVWSSAGNVKQHPAKPEPTPQERRHRDILETKFNGRVFSSVVEHADSFKTDGSRSKKTTADSCGPIVRWFYAGKQVV